MRLRLLLLTTGACLLVLGGSASAQSKKASSTNPKIIPAEWLPALAPSIRSALDNLKQANAQMEMNLLSREIADMTAAHLFIAYVRRSERLPQKERDALFAEQTKWLKSRVKAAEDGVESGRGSLAAFEANNAELTITEKRLAELRARLKALDNKKSSARAADGD